MQIVLQKRETTDGTLATGLLVGLWLGEVLATAEYWLLRAGSLGLGALSWVLRRPAVIVLAFVLACCGVVGAGALSRMKQARAMTAMLDIRCISSAAEIYRTETGQWPVTLEKMVPRFLKELHVDPWGHNYALYRGEGGIAIVSAGPDGELGTADDVFYVPPQS
ncbi:MAG: type II secretion system protein GspG [Myxococcales bacterium]